MSSVFMYKYAIKWGENSIFMQNKEALKLFNLETTDNANTHTKQFSIIFLSAILQPVL